MNGVDGSVVTARWSTRRHNLFRDVQQPGDLTHHVLLRDIDTQAFPWAVRELHRRLYVGEPSGDEQQQCVALRRGFPARWSAALFALGWFLMTILFVTGSDLGRGFQLLDGGGGTAQSAAPVLSLAVPESFAPGLLSSAAIFLGTALIMSFCSGRQFLLVAQKNSEGLLDLWVSGASWRCDAPFDREFTNFVASIHLRQCATLDEPQASKQGP